jgi:hypothetical protein
MVPPVSGTYGGAALHPDGSEYYTGNATVGLDFFATASNYYSLINAYRFRDASGVWSDWFTEPHIDLADLAAGDYPLLLMARDIAGEPSEPLAYTIHLVDFAISDTIVIVDETRDGSANPGSPTDAEVDEFYRSVIGDHPYREHDIATVEYLSPYNLRDAGLVIYHADDRSDMRLLENIPVLDDYLDFGCRLVISGWNTLGVFDEGDSIVFAAGSFGYERLQLEGARQLVGREATGFDGVGGYPGVTIDAAKLPASWVGSIDRCWVFSPREGCTELGALTVDNPWQNPLVGRTACYLYDGQFRIAVAGVPLFFCIESEVQTLFDALIPVMTAPTASQTTSPERITEMRLEQNYPNPFNSSTEITYQLPRTEIVALRIYDILGRQAATLNDGLVTVGTHHITFDGAALSSGIYFLKLSSSSSSATRKMILLK